MRNLAGDNLFGGRSRAGPFLDLFIVKHEHPSFGYSVEVVYGAEAFTLWQVKPVPDQHFL